MGVFFSQMSVIFAGDLTAVHIIYIIDVRKLRVDCRLK